MSLRVATITIDAHNPRRLAQWWQEVLGYETLHVDAEDEIAIETTRGDHQPVLLFVGDPNRKAGKNRIHLDLRPDDRDAEVARLEALGATRVDIGQTGNETWVVLADPEDNEFCILRGATD